MGDTTVIYYTGNTENEIFESKIRENLLKNKGDLPLISVSQKPLAGFGKNICVGPLPHCYASAFKQILVGLEAADTKFALMAESDFLYPPEYFTFTPPSENQPYVYDNIWVFYDWYGRSTRNYFWKKKFSEGASICGREYMIKAIKDILEIKDSKKLKKWFSPNLKYSWGSGNPAVTVKTVAGVSKWVRREKQPQRTKILPYWGEINQLRRSLRLEEYGS